LASSNGEKHRPSHRSVHVRLSNGLFSYEKGPYFSKNSCAIVYRQLECPPEINLGGLILGEHYIFGTKLTDETVKVYAYNFLRKGHFPKKTADFQE
jgi:hypothetical protein